MLMVGQTRIMNDKIDELSYPLLPTALVYCSDKYDKKQTEIRVLLDAGNHFNLIKSELVSTLNLPKMMIRCTVSGFEDTTTSSKALININIKSRINSFKLNHKCCVLAKIIL